MQLVQVVKTPDSVAAKSVSLANVMSYQNDAVVARIKRELGCSHEKAVSVFEDTKKFLWLCTEGAGSCIPSPVIDEGWHTFLLFTKDYQDFCQKYLGKFIHHRPSRPEDPPNDGSALRNTLVTIELKLGGNLGENWHYPKSKFSAECSGSDSCSGTTNCQEAQ